jgi:HK97 gp10 family phage protein
MPSVVEVRVSGLDKIEEALEHAPLRVAKRILRTALVAAGKIWKDEMISRVRRGPHHPPGGGKVSYDVIADHMSMSTSVKSDLEGSVSVGVSTKLYWGKFLEFGTGPRARRPKGVSKKSWRDQGSGNRMPAFPFIRISASARAEDVLEKFTSECRAALDEEFRS